MSHTTPFLRFGPDVQPRFLSDADCHDIGQRLARIAMGGGETIATIFSTWRGNVRWARNQISTSGEDRNDHVLIQRVLRGSLYCIEQINETTDMALMAAIRRAEQLAHLGHETPDDSQFTQYVPEPFTPPLLFSEATYQLDADHRAKAARQLAQAAATAGMLSAGYLEVSAHSQAKITSWGYTQYFQYTAARYSVTIRDSQGTGSGWAGVDWPDWAKIDAPTLSQIALDKCLTSRHPVGIEPGRYTTILESQAVCDFVGQLVYGEWTPDPGYQALDRRRNEQQSWYPFNARPGGSRIGERVVDERITMSADPGDPELGFPPCRLWMGWSHVDEMAEDVYHPATWIERGVLTNLAYDRAYAVNHLGRDTGLPSEGAFRMSGGDTSLADMIATTERGLLVTRFALVECLELRSLLLRGYTRDGLWLIERGKISKPVKNMSWMHSILSALNSVEQLGVPQRTFHPAESDWWALPQPVVVPPLKVRDFTFTSLTNAV